MFTSNLTASEFVPIDSNTCGSTSPVGNGIGAFAAAAKSRGIGGRIFDAVGECERALLTSLTLVESSPASRFPDRVASAGCIGACDDTWKNDDDAELGVMLSTVPPDGRLGSSFSFVSRLSRLRFPNDSFDDLRATDFRVPSVSFDPVDPCFR